MVQGAAIIGGGPAGLMAAEVLAAASVPVTVFDWMPTVGRKFLMAGRGGLNLTHSEPIDTFVMRYGAARTRLEPLIRRFPPTTLVEWCQNLGQGTFVGSSGRVFPVAMKASPLLRAWLARLSTLGVAVRPRHRWAGWDGDRLCFETPEGEAWFTPSVTVLSVGGASWPRLGSDGAWAGHLQDSVVPFRPSNCGVRIDWSPVFRTRFSGHPLKRVAMRFGGETVRGEAVVTESGLEGGAVYALSARLRDALEAGGPVVLSIDLRPDLEVDRIRDLLDIPRRGKSLSNILRGRIGLAPEAIGLVQEALRSGAVAPDLAALIKGIELSLTGTMPLGRAISSAGGLRWDAVDDDLMLRDRPGIFAAGEMLDWEAPTGGYLLQACFSTGYAAASGALRWLDGLH